MCYILILLYTFIILLLLYISSTCAAPTNSSSTGDSPCSPGFKLHNNYCYLPVKKSYTSTWENAKKTCQDNSGSYLVTLTDENKQFLADLVKNDSSDKYWIGLRQYCHKGPHIWFDGITPASYNWVQAAPQPALNDSVVTEHMNMTTTSAPYNYHHRMYKGRYGWTTTSMPIPMRTTTSTGQRLPCVYVDAESGKWDTAYCSDTRVTFAFVCQTPKTGYTEKQLKLFPSVHCDVGWCKSRSWCYKFSGTGPEDDKPFLKAKESCIDMGANLVSIHDDIENQFVLDTIDVAVGDPSVYATKRQIIIGLSLLESLDENKFLWTDNSPTDYLNFLDGQPDLNNEFNRESCAEIFDSAVGGAMKNPSWVGKWNDMRCDDSRPFVCKKWAPGVKRVEYETPKYEKGGCRPGWRQFENRCFKLFGTNEDDVDPKNHEEADAYCATIGTMQHTALVSIHNVFEQLFIQSLLAFSGQSFWIGAFFTSSTARWSDQSLVTYTNWQTDTHSFTHNSCAFMKHNRTAGKWATVSGYGTVGLNCKSLLPFICAERTKPGLAETSAYGMVNGCDIGFIKFGNGCFKFFETAQSFEEAHATCSNAGASLVSLQDSQDFAFTVSLAKSSGNDDFWIGLRDVRDAQGEHLVWDDGYPVYFTRWGANEPIDDSDKLCIFMELSQVDAGLWRSERCTSKKPFLCNKRPKAPKFSIAVQPGTCPTGWIQASTNCLLLIKNQTTNYFKAPYLCRKLDTKAKLASLHSMHDILMLTKREEWHNLTNEVYIGLFQSVGGIDGYSWDDDSPLDYTNWGEGEPEHPDSCNVEECVYMDSIGQWHDTGCETQLHALCARPKDASIDDTSNTSSGDKAKSLSNLTESPKTENSLSIPIIIVIIIGLILFIMAVTGILIWLRVLPVPVFLNKKRHGQMNGFAPVDSPSLSFRNLVIECDEH